MNRDAFAVQNTPSPYPRFTEMTRDKIWSLICTGDSNGRTVSECIPLHSFENCCNPIGSSTSVH